MRSISPWHAPQSVPAPHARPTAATSLAPSSIARRTALHDTPLHKQTIIERLQGNMLKATFNIKFDFGSISERFGAIPDRTRP